MNPWFPLAGCWVPNLSVLGCNEETCEEGTVSKSRRAGHSHEGGDGCRSRSFGMEWVASPFIGYSTYSLELLCRINLSSHRILHPFHFILAS